MIWLLRLLVIRWRFSHRTTDYNLIKPKNWLTSKGSTKGWVNNWSCDLSCDWSYDQKCDFDHHVLLMKWSCDQYGLSRDWSCDLLNFLQFFGLPLKFWLGNKFFAMHYMYMYFDHVISHVTQHVHVFWSCDWSRDSACTLGNDDWLM